MKTSKYYLVGLTAIVVSLMCCGPVSAEYIYDFNGLTANGALHGQDGWAKDGGNTSTVRDEATAKASFPIADQPNWTGFSGNVVNGVSDVGHYRLNDGNWSFSIPSSAPEVRFSYTIFTRGSAAGNVGNMAGLYMGDQQLFRLGVKWDENKWRFRDRDNDDTFAVGTGDATLTDSHQSYILTAVLDFTTDPTKVYADMWVENLTAGTAAVEVMSDIDLGLVGDELDPSNWDKLFLRLKTSGAIDDMTVTAIPEPSTLALLATGLIGLLCYAWRKRK